MSEPTILGAGIIERLEADGWYVRRDKHHVGLCRTFKNGKPRKTPEVAIAYWPTNEVLDWGTGEPRIVQKESTRPWRVERKGQRARSFTDYHNALGVFLEHAKQVRP